MNIDIEIFNTIFRFICNLSVAIIIIKFIYSKRYSENDFVFSYFMFNSLIFFFALLISNVEINIGFGFGLFAIFAILRYRTDPIPIREMTYLFIFITIGVLNAIVDLKASYLPLILVNTILLCITYLSEKYWQKNLLLSINIEYENIENVKQSNYNLLLEDLQKRTGFKVLKYDVKKINFLRDTATIKIFYKEQ